MKHFENSMAQEENQVLGTGSCQVPFTMYSLHTLSILPTCVSVYFERFPESDGRGYLL